MPLVKIRRHPDAPWPADVPEAGLLTVEPGQIIELDSSIAGAPPRWRALDDGEGRVPWREYRDRAGRTEVHDLGSGLLAQITNWQPHEPKRYSGRTNETKDDS